MLLFSVDKLSIVEVMATSRRNFLFGRKSSASPWGQFCARLARTTQGAFSCHEDLARQVGRLMPAREQDIFHAHALCSEYGVQFWLDGLPTEPPEHKPILWVQAGCAWATAEPLAQRDETPEIWRVEAGYGISGLLAHGFDWLQDVNSTWSIAQWLASPQASGWGYGQGATSGIVKVRVLMADGTVADLGPFGAQATEPLQSITVQKLVPKLFELTHTDIARACSSHLSWPGRLRLDALTPLASQEINLSHLLTGHAGSLVWLLCVWLEKTPQAAYTKLGSQSAQTAALSNPQLSELLELDVKIKNAFDPIGLFAPLPAPKGLESDS
jgi:hypothetical protein